jgi:hypothetical protein
MVSARACGARMADNPSATVLRTVALSAIELKHAGKRHSGTGARLVPEICRRCISIDYASQEPVCGIHANVTMYGARHEISLRLSTARLIILSPTVLIYLGDACVLSAAQLGYKRSPIADNL